MTKTDLDGDDKWWTKVFTIDEHDKIKQISEQIVSEETDDYIHVTIPISRELFFDILAELGGQRGDSDGADMLLIAMLSEYYENDSLEPDFVASLLYRTMFEQPDDLDDPDEDEDE